MDEAAKKLSKAFWSLGAVLLPGSFTVGRPGGDIHYAGTLPMRESPSPGETSPRGEVEGLDGIFVVDGACLPTLSEKSHTLTIMANADRIGRKLAACDESRQGELS
jgi:choline dehydrogenase-like flavoprotein